MSATKLTLKLEQEVIEHTKEYAKRHHTTLSGMVENYFRALTGDQRKKIPLTPLVRELSGILPAKTARDWKKRYAEYLIHKYS